MYRQGQGVQQNYVQAFTWYKKSAEQGFTKAQYNLGVMYANGDGIKQNPLKAKEWYKKSCDNGNQKGCNNYRKLNEQGY